MRLRGISTAIFLMLPLLSVTLTESTDTRRSIKDNRSIRNYDSESLTLPNSSQTLNVEHDLGLLTIKNHRNSPELDSFLKNVLKAQNELKWIDQVGHKTGTKETQEKVQARYLRTPLHSPAARHHDKIRFKRKSGPRSDHESWTFPRRRSYEDDNSEGFYPDDSTLKHWAKEEGLRVPGSWFRSDQSIRKSEDIPADQWSTNKIRESRRMDEFSRGVEDWADDGRDERGARSPSARNTLEEPTLESLKNTVLELRKSLEEGDKKINAFNEKKDAGIDKNQERHAEDISTGKESHGNDENLRNQNWNSYEGRDDQEVSPGSNWWEDPRSAVDMFDFKRRDDDVDDEDDDDDDPEFDDTRFRVKRDKEGEDDDGGEKSARVYRRAGFGELYPEDASYEKNPEERIETRRVYREIRETDGTDKINDERNFDGDESGDRKSVDISANENGHSGDTAVEGIKNLRDNIPREKSGVPRIPENRQGERTPGTIGDSNLEDAKNAGILSEDEKRSSSSRGRDEEREQELSAPKVLGEILKIEPPVPNNFPRKKKESRNTEEKKEVEKSDPNDDDVHKLSQDPEEDKKRGNEEQKKEERIEDHSENLGEKRSEDEITKTQDATLADLNTGEPSNSSDEESLNSVDKILDHENRPEIKSKLEPERGEKGSRQDSKIVELEPKRTNTEIKDPDEKDGSKSEVPGYREESKSDKENAKYQKHGENDGAEAKNEKESGEQRNLDTKGKILPLKSEDSMRKLLWLSDESTANEESENAEIRDGRRDSTWDQNRYEKSGQRSANFLKNTQTVNKGHGDDSKFSKRSLMVSNDDTIDAKAADPESRGFKNRDEIRTKKESDLVENAYEEEDEGVAQDDDDLKHSGVNNGGEVNRSVESEGKSQSSLVRISNRDGDRDPMRDRINMLIKEKLNNKAKGKLTHFKREVENHAAVNIQYYDYDSDSDADATGMEDGQHSLERDSTTYPEVSVDKESETITKKDENKEEEMREESDREKCKNNAPKEEFISDVELAKTQKKKPTSCKINPESSESSEKSWQRFDENRIKDTLQDTNAGAEIMNTKSNNQWLGEPGEAYPEQEQDSVDRQDRYQDSGEDGDREKVLDTGKAEVLGDPLEYSVNIRGKLNPESIDAMVNEKSYTKEKEQGINNEKPNANKLRIETDEENWKYEGTRDKSRFQSDERINDDDDDDDEFGNQEIGEKLSGRDWRYRDSARIEEGGTKDPASLQNSNETAVVEDVSLSREARLVQESDQDSLPTMLDRSGPRNLPPGERTYLVIAPAQAQCSRKQKDENSSSSSASNYLALKVTDDMFKGGIEQSNPIDDQIPEANFMGKTTTEWKVIKIGEDNARVKSNSKYEEEPKSSKDFAINPRDVVRESIVNPEEMAGDFDDDAKPSFGRDLKCVRKSHRHFGRSLQSISHPIDPTERVRIEVDSNGGKKPVHKYLENTQTRFENSETTGDPIKKSIATSDVREDAEKSSEKIPIVNSEEKNLAKRSSELETPSNPAVSVNATEIDKDKRGLTNIEEWEMNAPTVQKQHPISGSDLGMKGITLDIKYPSLMTEKKNSELQITPKTSLLNFYDATSGSHERESRSIKFKDDDFKFDLISANHESLADKRRSKIRRRPVDTNSRKYDYNEDYGVGYKRDWKKSRRRRSKENAYWKGNQDDLTSVREDELERGHHGHKVSEKHHNKGLRSKEILPVGRDRESLRVSTDLKAPLKGMKSHGERSFKEVEGYSVKHNAKEPNRMMAGAIGHRHTSLQSESFEAEEGYDSGNVEDPEGSKPEFDDGQKKKFKVLLATDNTEDESQMDLALHGELAGKIVEKIFDQVQKNDALKIALGPGLYRKHKSEDAIETDKIYRQGLDQDEVKYTEGMMKRVMELLGRLILDEVQRKTCASLPPDMREFLQWMLGVEDENRAMDQVPPLPFVHNQESNQRQDEKFLFEDSPKRDNESADIDELNKKVRILKSLINEYNSLTDKEKTKVQMVHDYLIGQLEVLLNYIDEREMEVSKTSQPERIGNGNILQYQNAVPNPNGSVFSFSTLSPLVNTPSILMLSNASFVEPPKASNRLVPYRIRNTRNSEEGEEGVKKKQKKRKHRKQKHPKNQEGDQRKRKRKHKKKKKKKKNQHGKLKGIQSPEYKKLIRKAALLRKKRANLYEDNWDPVDSGYEEPAIYTSSGELANKRKGSLREKRLQDENEEIDDMYSRKDSKTNGNVFNLVKSKEEEPGTVSQIIRDILSASTVFQPLSNRKSEDLVSSNYPKDLKNEFVHGSLVSPVHLGTTVIEEKRDADKTEGRNLSEDKATLSNKREAWKTKNEQQLEEVAFGKDMRGKWREKEQFEKLTEMDKKKNPDDGGKRKKREEDNEIKSTSDFEDTNKSIDEGNSTSVKITEEINPSNESLDFAKLQHFRNSAVKTESFEPRESEVSEKSRKELKKLFNKEEKKRSLPEINGAVVFPLLETPERREKLKQADTTEKDDQMLGFETASIARLNTY